VPAGLRKLCNEELHNVLLLRDISGTTRSARLRMAERIARREVLRNSYRTNYSIVLSDETPFNLIVTNISGGFFSDIFRVEGTR
jgi:hypothetical protein